MHYPTTKRAATARREMLTLGFSLRWSWSWCLFGLCSGTPATPPPPFNSTFHCLHPPLSSRLACLHWLCQFHILCSAVLFLFLPLLHHLHLLRLQLFLLYFEIVSVVVVAVLLSSLSFFWFILFIVFCLCVFPGIPSLIRCHKPNNNNNIIVAFFTTSFSGK